MHILLLTPQPFYQERGTPIAANLMLRAFSARGDTVDQLAYAEGAEVSHPGCALHRIPRLPFTRGIRPGFSGKKLLCDVVFFWSALGRVLRRRPDLIVATEEAVFIARFWGAVFRIPFVYDMDSLMSQQIRDGGGAVAKAAGLLEWMERGAARAAAGVIAVCDALGDFARAAGARRVAIVRDISLLPDAAGAPPEPLRAELGIGPGPLFLYLGNLEKYQGVDLLLEAFGRMAAREPSTSLVCVGGPPHVAAALAARAETMGLRGRAFFPGPRPVARMAGLFAAADVLVSPRITGNNTPMKIYSYLHSGRPVLATDIPSHTQVLTPEIAALSAPDPEALAAAMLDLARDPGRRERLAAAARALAEERHTWPAFQRDFDRFFADVGQALNRTP